MAKRNRRDARYENAAKAALALFLLLALLLSKGDIKKFPSVLITLFAAAVGLAIIAAIVWVAYRILIVGRRPVQTTQPASSHRELADANSGLVLTRRSNSAPPGLPSRPSEMLDKIDWYQFEKVVGGLLSQEGFQVEQRGGSRDDGGVDLIATGQDGVPLLVQCKFWKSWDLNLKTIRELLGARESAEFRARNAKAVVYSLSDPTERAVAFAHENGIMIVSRPEIADRLDKFPLTTFPELADPNAKRCPKCDAPMVNRGTFWGCSNYGRTRCRGTIQFDAERA